MNDAYAYVWMYDMYSVQYVCKCMSVCVCVCVCDNTATLQQIITSLLTSKSKRAYITAQMEIVGNMPWILGKYINDASN